MSVLVCPFGLQALLSSNSQDCLAWHCFLFKTQAKVLGTVYFGDVVQLLFKFGEAFSVYLVYWWRAEVICETSGSAQDM
jgi:hypothetical protein